MEIYPKFVVITDDEYGLCLIIAKCTFHKQLHPDVTKIKGGGFWDLNRETNTFTLSGSSHDFGAATIEDIQTCINNNNVYTNSSLCRNITNKYKFEYDTQSEIIKL